MDVKGYTVDKLLKNLVLVEEHAGDFVAESSDMCAECLEKHLLLVSGLAGEGIGFFDNPEKQLFVEMSQWADERRQGLNALDAESAALIQQEARGYRKTLIAGASTCERCASVASLFGDDVDDAGDRPSQRHFTADVGGPAQYGHLRA